MAKLSLEKYVEGCVKNLKDKFTEEMIISHIELIKQVGEYNGLAVRVAYDGCHIAYPTWEKLSKEDYDNCNGAKIKSLYLKAFKIAYPKGWEKIEELR